MHSSTTYAVRRWGLSMAFGLLGLGCTKPTPSPEYAEAKALHTRLIATHGDDAYLNPEMEQVEQLLRKVPSNSLDASGATVLGERIKDDRRRIETSRRQALDQLDAEGADALNAAVKLDREAQPLDADECASESALVETWLEDVHTFDPEAAPTASSFHAEIEGLKRDQGAKSTGRRAMDQAGVAGRVFGKCAAVGQWLPSVSGLSLEQRRPRITRELPARLKQCQCQVESAALFELAWLWMRQE